MRRYETVWVVHGDLPDEEVKAAIDKYSKIISAQGGILIGLEEWGRRKLAYKIKGTGRGFYVLAEFAGLPATVKELERNYRIDDRIIRYLTLLKGEKVDPVALQAEKDARAQAAAPREEPAAPPVVETQTPAAEIQAEEKPPAKKKAAKTAGPPAEEAPPAESPAPGPVEEE